VSLNDYRDEAAEFLNAVGGEVEDAPTILAWIDDELAVLREAAGEGDLPKLRHQVYDVLFLLLELAARFDLDLDSEREKCGERKRLKCLSKGNGCDLRC